MAQMTTDTAILAQEAGNFERDPIRLPPRTNPPPPTVITAAPPDTPQRNNDPLPNCTAGDEAEILGEAAAGAVTIAGGAIADPFTLGAGIAPILGGITMVGDAANDISKCD